MPSTETRSASSGGGDRGQVADLAYRLTGSSDLYEKSGRRPHASINFVTAHDGYTLRDLVSFEKKHNHANGEQNRDGHDDNLSWNCGVEGATDNPEILALRQRQVRNFLATLIVSHGVPMILAGDEFGRTQQGNNNAYCQDSELVWLDWDLDEAQGQMLQFARLVIRLFHKHPVLRRQRFFKGRASHGSEAKDIAWFRPDANEMSDQDWSNADIRCLGAQLAGDAIEEVDDRGIRIKDDTLLILFNASGEARSFLLPTYHAQRKWRPILDTRTDDGNSQGGPVSGGEEFVLESHSLALFRLGNS